MNTRFFAGVAGFLVGAFLLIAIGWWFYWLSGVKVSTFIGAQWVIAGWILSGFVVMSIGAFGHDRDATRPFQKEPPFSKGLWVALFPVEWVGVLMLYAVGGVGPILLVLSAMTFGAVPFMLWIWLTFTIAGQSLG